MLTSDSTYPHPNEPVDAEPQFDGEACGLTLSCPEADLFVPDGEEPRAALARTTHLGIVAHQDDLEIAAYHGIAECYQQADRWFAGVVLTDGGGSPRTGRYAKHSDSEMRAVRRREQRKAAVVGEYGAVLQLGWASSVVKRGDTGLVTDELRQLLLLTRPEVVYLHNPTDRHDTHVACFWRAMEALRSLPAEARPRRVYGCEVWRKLDWLVAADKQLLRVDQHPNLALPLVGVFDSQIVGGKRYDLAEDGLRRANATYFDSHTTDGATQLSFAMDLTPLVINPSLDISEFTLGFVDRLRADVEERLHRYGPGSSYVG